MNVFTVPEFTYQITQISASVPYNTEGYQQLSVCSYFMFDDKDKLSNFKQYTGMLIPAVLADWLTWRFNLKGITQNYILYAH